MKFVSFNINGLRARLHQLEAIITKLQPDVIGLQETKVHDNFFPLKEIKRRHVYHVYFHGQKSHYGVAFLSKKKFLSIRSGFDTDDDKAQCRIIMAEFVTPQGLLTVVNGYFPQGTSRQHPHKFLAKQSFYQKLQDYVEKKHAAESLLLIMGDMNISPTDRDIGIGEENRKRWLSQGKCSFLPEERVWIERLFACGLVDTYRQANPNQNDIYSWFDYRSQGFNKNRGLRIDLLLASRPLAKYVQSTGINYSIRAMVKPSDHAPVWVDFAL